MDFVLPPEKGDFKNSKIRTLQILAKCGLPHLKVKIITPAAFEEYYQNKKITPDLFRVLTKVFESLLQDNRQVSIRLAIEKGVDILLPRSESLNDLSSCLRFTQKTWDFFIKNSKNPNGLGIAILAHRFIPSFAAGTLDSSLPRKKSLMMIEATYGIWEGIQSNLHDVYIVDKDILKPIKKIIPEKDSGLFPTLKNRWKYQRLPVAMRSRQVVSDGQIEELTKQAGKIERHFGPARIEFILKEIKPQQSKKAVLLWHITKMPAGRDVFHYKVVPLSEEVGGETVYIGYPFMLEDINDISKIKLISHPRPILYLSDKIISKRDLYLIQRIALLAKEQQWPILYKGGQLTHISIILREYGVTVFPVNQNIRVGKKIKIVRSLI